MQIHLGTMELKERWKTLEPRMYEAEKYLNEVGEASTSAIDEVVKRARDLREQLKQTRQGYKKVGPNAH